MGESFGITWASLALTVFLLISPVAAHTDCNWWEQAPPPVVHGKVMPSCWWKEVKRSSARYHVNPFLAAAVAWIEGNGWDPDRIGHSPYWGPMGINEYCPVSYRVLSNPLSNIRVGVAALRGNNPKAVLKRYNAKWFKDHYIRDVLALKRQLEREAMLLVRFSGKTAGRSAS
jgi:soluble lytic murein transglycosylase-like protein